MTGIVAGATGMPRVIAHRGFHVPGGPHENSLASFEAAAAVGADMLELDIRRTRDGVLVVYHDPTLADGRKIADLTYAELPHLPNGEPIPRLHQVASIARRAGIRMQAELKEGGYEAQALREMLLFMPKRNLDVISFRPTSIAAVERYDPALRTGVLEPRLPGWMRGTPLYPFARWTLDALELTPSINTAERVGADYVSAEHEMVTPEFVRAAHGRGMQVYAWTVNDAARMAQLVASGADGIVTDRPDIARQVVGSPANATGAAVATPVRFDPMLPRR